ncbi:uncharacterized protein LOC126377242 [Pectinophora gossypiella]|uniref:Uncharacterized protein n=1 Tax=Pectinophora gossypiella TaxID=13191 RepID=A0A1E1WSM6_PECGO|nr:uncharacterized protein LOC126377242 [Pectinophora gossypiella]XP_049880916.1 uncharacterized protein LOC126377242 [Pectinophora gossypiella]XP_049880917.1 uncharacterized protein LOC126377242 [Pectinophora gossypiella]
MAKFLKSFFTPDKRKTSRMEGEGEEVNDFTPPMDGRRNLSISRSGRMRQAHKKRHSLSMELYGEKNQPTEKPKSVEYHVNKSEATLQQNKRSSTEQEVNKEVKEHAEKNVKEDKRRNSVDMIKTPEEEIESAFEVIDKVL